MFIKLASEYYFYGEKMIFFSVAPEENLETKVISSFMALLLHCGILQTVLIF